MSEPQTHTQWSLGSARPWLTRERLTDYGLGALLLVGAVWAILALPTEISINSLLLIFAPAVTVAAFWRGLAPGLGLTAVGFALGIGLGDGQVGDRREQQACCDMNQSCVHAVILDIRFVNGAACRGLMCHDRADSTLPLFAAHRTAVAGQEPWRTPHQRR